MRQLALAVSVVVALTACSTLPDYAAPKARTVSPESLGGTDLIAYRTLVREDFKGRRPPPEFAAVSDRIGAATCAYLLTTPDTQIMLHPTRRPDGSVFYRSGATQLRFFAQMDRNCSWWNPGKVGLPDDYILEHEQIHFALFELEARRLNESAAEIGEAVSVTADSKEEAARGAQEQLTAQIRARLDQILARSRQFDADTSMGHNPRAQKRWWDRVNAELAQPAP